MQEQVFISLPKNELTGLIVDCVKACLEAHNLTGDTVNNGWLGVKEASVYTSIPLATLRIKASQRTIPCVKKGKRLYFNRVELDRYMNEGRQKTIEELASETEERIIQGK